MMNGEVGGELRWVGKLIIIFIKCCNKKGNYAV